MSKSNISAALIIGIALFGAFAAHAQPSLAQDTAAALTAAEIMQRAASVSSYQDTLLAHTKFKVREEVIFSELGGKGEIKNSDTVICTVVMEGHKEISRETIYTTKRKEADKKEQSQEAGVGFSYSDTNFTYSLAESNDNSYTIAVSPKAEPKTGDVRGTITIDRTGFYTKAIDFEVPKPEGALKEFSTRMSFESLEGGLVVLKEMRIKGFAKALLGIFKMRFSISIRYSDYEILK